MIRQHEQTNLQVFVFMFVLSFVGSMIKYRVCQYYSHTLPKKSVTVQELRMFV